MEIIFPLLLIGAFVLLLFPSKSNAKPIKKPPADDNDINKAWWKGYQAGYEARCNELKSKQ